MAIAEGRRRWGGYGITVVVLLLAACTSSREPDPLARGTSTSTSTTPLATTDATDATSPAPSTVDATAVTTSPTSRPPRSRGGTTTVTGSAVAGASGAAETGRPFRATDPFSEAVRLRNGTCVGWEGSRGGSTAGLAAGARVLVLDAEADEEIGRGRIERSRWEDVSKGGRQWNCYFDFTATVTGRAPREFRIRVAGLQPWLASPDPNAPDTFVASVSTGADVGLIRSCPPLPGQTPERPRRTTTTVSARLSSRWHAIGQYWSQGVDSLCRAGLAVTAVARPCRPPRVGSEYISAVVDSNDSTVTYRDGERVPVGTQVTVVVATGHPCE